MVSTRLRSLLLWVFSALNLLFRTNTLSQTPTVQLQVGYEVELKDNKECHKHTANRIVRVTHVPQEEPGESLQQDGQKAEYKGRVISQKNQQGCEVAFCMVCYNEIIAIPQTKTSTAPSPPAAP